MANGTIGPDFVMAQLTPDGLAFAKGAPLTISNGRSSLTFTPGKPLKVARYEWNMLLRDHCVPTGKSCFEIAPELVAQAISAKKIETPTSNEEKK